MLVILYDWAFLGYGLFTNLPISPGDWICTYTRGELRRKGEEHLGNPNYFYYLRWQEKTVLYVSPGNICLGRVNILLNHAADILNLLKIFYVNWVINLLNIWSSVLPELKAPCPLTLWLFIWHNVFLKTFLFKAFIGVNQCQNIIKFQIYLILQFWCIFSNFWCGAFCEWWMGET